MHRCKVGVAFVEGSACPFTAGLCDVHLSSFRVWSAATGRALLL
jgi:hypothetical protein